MPSPFPDSRETRALPIGVKQASQGSGGSLGQNSLVRGLLWPPRLASSSQAAGKREGSREAATGLQPWLRERFPLMGRGTHPGPQNRIRAKQAKQPRTYLHECVTLCHKVSFGDLLELVTDVWNTAGFQYKVLVLLN